MKCPKCQFENPQGQKFCGECGTKLEIACPKCNSPNPPQFKFCGECGHDLSKPTEARQLDCPAPKSYTPRFLAEKILTTRSAIEGERKLVTVLFADVANFTSISEKLDPEEVHTIMDGCFKILIDEVHKYEGTINQFTGDGVMALFGAPVAHEDHAARACHAALSIQKAMGDYGEKVARDYGAEFKMRIGLNSGPVIVGAIGDDLRMDYTAVGDTTNLASRMESMAQPQTVLLSKNTQRLVKEYFELRQLGKFEVKGKEEPQEVFELIRTGGATSRLEAVSARGLTRFVGREQPLAALMEAYEKVKSGSGQVVGIVGEAGVGKSRLLLEFRELVSGDEITYLEGRCIHFGGSVPYLPILNILKSYFRIAEAERETVTRKRIAEEIMRLDEKLEGILSPLQDLLSLKVEDDAYLKLDPKLRRERIFEALRDLIVRGSQEQPLVLAIEDLQWIDRSSEEFLDYFIGWLPTVRALLILLHRPEYTNRWGSKSYFNRIGLDQLPIDSSTELVRAILEEGEIASDLRNLILNKAAGNPLFVEELTQALLENGAIERKDKKYVLATVPSNLEVPDTIQGIIAARLDRLSENQKKIMQVASVIGREFAFRILQAISGMKEDLKSQLLNLQGLEFIYEKRLFPELEYIFKHALTHEVAYNSLLTNRRKEIHKKIGNAIEALYGEHLEEFYEVLAYHYSRGEETEKALNYLKLAGKKAADNCGLWEAYGFYKEALEVLNRLPDTEEKKREMIDIVLLLGTPLGLLGFPEGSFSILEKAEGVVRELGDNRRLAAFCSRMGSYYTQAADHRMALKYTQGAFEEALKAKEMELLVPLGVSLCFTYSASGMEHKIIETFPPVIEAIEKSGRETDFFRSGTVNPYSFICGKCATSLSFLGRFQEAAFYAKKSLSNASKLNHMPSLGISEFSSGIPYYLKGELEYAKDHMEKSIDCCRKAKFDSFLGPTQVVTGHVYSLLGSPEVGKRYAENGLNKYHETKVEYLLALCHWMMGQIHLDAGDLMSAQGSMEESLRLSVKNKEKAWEGVAWLGLGQVLGKKEAQVLDMAEKCFSKGLQILEEEKMKSFYSQGLLFLGEFYLDTGDKEKSIENLKKAESLFQEMGMDYWLGKSQEALKRL